MIFSKETKANWKFLAILMIVAILAGGITIAVYFWTADKLNVSNGNLTLIPSRSEICYKNETNINCHGMACMHDPASGFCSCMGGRFSTKQTSEGSAGQCTIGGKTYDEWEYFCGKIKNNQYCSNKK